MNVRPDITERLRAPFGTRRCGLEYLVTVPDGVYVDATYGRGGHSRLILSRLSGSARLVALDRDARLGSKILS